MFSRSALLLCFFSSSSHYWPVLVDLVRPNQYRAGEKTNMAFWCVRVCVCMVAENSDKPPPLAVRGVCVCVWNYVCVLGIIFTNCCQLQINFHCTVINSSTSRGRAQRCVHTRGSAQSHTSDTPILPTGSTRFGEQLFTHARTHAHAITQIHTLPFSSSSQQARWQRVFRPSGRVERQTHIER